MECLRENNVKAAEAWHAAGIRLRTANAEVARISADGEALIRIKLRDYQRANVASAHATGSADYAELRAKQTALWADYMRAVKTVRPEMVAAMVELQEARAADMLTWGEYMASNQAMAKHVSDIAQEHGGYESDYEEDCAADHTRKQHAFA
jgi:hypothetical protein